jgi:hypothetical protein
MLWVVAPLLQTYASQEGAPKATDPPWQKVRGPEATTLDGGVGFTVTTWDVELLLHPLADTVTPYEPLADTEMLWVVAPLLHK